jgi:DUF4097 and DUF4098 domain-containing protein YvlB
MKRSRSGSARTLAVVSMAIAALIATNSLHAEAGTPKSYTFESSELELQNLIGEVTISGHGGSSFEVTVTFHGKDATDGAMTVIREDDGGRGRLVVQFPPDSKKFVYPAMGKNSSTSFSPDHGEDRSWMAEVIGGLFGSKVTVRGSGSGLEMWADVEVRVPSSGELVVRHGVGQLRVDGVDGDLDMELRSGRVGVDGVSGDLSVETGSGRVEVARVDGKLEASTGSGRVTASEIRGPEVSVATGSGGVELDRVETDSLSVATGSGRVEASGVRADRADIATGSGGVHLALDRMGSGDFNIGTGSGGVVLKVPAEASLDVHAETGSGGIDLNLDGEMTMRRKERDEVEFTLRGGDARVRIGTGSGGIRISESG